jgi:hypothetical protein
VDSNQQNRTDFSLRSGAIFRPVRRYKTQGSCVRVFILAGVFLHSVYDPEAAGAAQPGSLSREKEPLPNGNAHAGAVLLEQERARMLCF